MQALISGKVQEDITSAEEERTIYSDDESGIFSFFSFFVQITISHCTSGIFMNINIFGNNINYFLYYPWNKL